MGKQWKQWQTLFSWAPKWLQIVTAAMNLKDACSLEGKLWQTFVVVVQSLSSIWPFVNPWTAAHQASMSFTISQAYSNSCPLSQWCHPTISSPVISFSSCLQSFPASGSFQMSQLFPSGGQNIGASASASVLPMNIQGLISFRIDWLDLLAI